MQVSEELQQAINRTWSAIGNDVLDSFHMVKEDPTVAECIEMCLDADRMLMYGDSVKAVADYHNLISHYGYQKTLVFLASHPNLQLGE